MDKKKSSIDFEERVKTQLQQKRFELPQETRKVDAMFCNEAVYGKANILWGCGVIRLESSSTTTGNNEGSFDGRVISDFDVWPSKEGKKMMKRLNDRFVGAVEDELGSSDIQSNED